MHLNIILSLVIVLISVFDKRVSAQNVLLKGDVNIVVILNHSVCYQESHYRRTLVNSALWVAERVNFLNLLQPLKLGLTVYDSCSETDYFKAAFELYLTNLNSSNHTLGIVTETSLDEREQKFSDLLKLKTRKIRPNSSYVVKAAVHFLQTVGWRSNVTLITTEERIVDLFYVHSKKSRVCLKTCHVVQDSRLITLNATGEDPLVFFGTSNDITRFMANDTHLDERLSTNNILLIPTDGELPLGIPEDAYVILPPHWRGNQFKLDSNIFPTPILFEIADPILKFAVETQHFLKNACNDTIYKLNCLRQSKPSDMHETFFPFLSSRDIMGLLKVEMLEEHFVYDVFKVDSFKANTSTLFEANIFMKPFKKVASYHMFYDNLSVIDQSLELNSSNNIENCPELIIFRSDSKLVYWNGLIAFREDSWIYAFLSLSLLGVTFCMAILVFLLTAIYQKRILEGNPLMTIFLLFAVMLVFCAVLPFSIESTQKSLCTVKLLSITLSYAAVFSLLLSRAIVLSSAAKEIGFISHIAGQVQSFLCLFIFGVQAALSLHSINYCTHMFKEGYDFIFLMSYNIVLLLILLCLAPLMYKSQRNYREGKYFTIAIALIVVTWCVWLPGFAVLCSEWKEMMVCLGLVTTGGICLGTIFIPRTYLMTIAAERDKITSALPSLNTTTSGLDIYRAHPQPIYDCINIAAINAATVARAGVTPSAPDSNGLQQPDLYSCPALPEDFNFDLRCDTPTSHDKVTRF